MKRAIVIGGSSGIGKALVRVLLQEGYFVGVVARRRKELLELQGDMVLVKEVDVTRVEEARWLLGKLIKEMGGVDLVIISAGVLFHNQTLSWEEEKKTIETNVLGFAGIAECAMNYFLTRGEGHLVGISSIAAIRGRYYNPSYSASKAFVSNFLEGLRVRVTQEKRNITITDIQPGWVDTAMIQGRDVFWVASPKVAAHQIYVAIQKKRMHAYITGRWRLIAWLLKILPKFLYVKWA